MKMLLSFLVIVLVVVSVPWPMSMLLKELFMIYSMVSCLSSLIEDMQFSFGL